MGPSIQIYYQMVDYDETMPNIWKKMQKIQKMIKNKVVELLFLVISGVNWRSQRLSKAVSWAKYFLHKNRILVMKRASIRPNLMNIWQNWSVFYEEYHVFDKSWFRQDFFKIFAYDFIHGYLLGLLVLGLLGRIRVWSSVRHAPGLARRIHRPAGLRTRHRAWA